MITLDIAKKYGWVFLGQAGRHLMFRKETGRDKYAQLCLMTGGLLHMQKEQYRNEFTGVVKDETQFKMLMEMLELDGNENISQGA